MAGWTAKPKDENYWDGCLGAKVFKGDGSQLTGISAGAATSQSVVDHLASEAIHFTSDALWTDINLNTANIDIVSGAQLVTESSLAAHTHTLDVIEIPANDKTFTMANKELAFTWTAPTGHALDIEGAGGFGGDLVHIHQHSGNPSAVNLLYLEASDPDVKPLVISGAHVQSICADKRIETTDTVSGANISAMSEAIIQNASVIDDVSGAHLVTEASLAVHEASNAIHFGSAALWAAVGGGGGGSQWASGANFIYPTFSSLIVSGAGIETAGHVSGANITILESSLDTVSGAQLLTETSLATLSTYFDDLSGAHLLTESSLATLAGYVNTVSGAQLLTETSLANLSGYFNTLSGAHETLDTSHGLLADYFDTISGAYTTHAADSTDPHGALLTQAAMLSSASVSAAKLAVTADFETLSGAYVANVVYGHSDAPNAATDYPRGTVYIQYTP